MLKQLLQKRETYLGLAAAMAFQIIFFVVWLTAYDGVYERVNQMELALIVEDEQMGATIAEELVDLDEVGIQVYKSLDKAKSALENQTIHMILHMDRHFTENILAGQQAELDYYINQATPSLQRQMMDEISSEITAKVDAEVFRFKQEALLSETVMFQSDIPGETEQGIGEYLTTITNKITQHPVKANMTKVYERDGFSISMIPLLIVLASFIGAMLISQHLQFADMKISKDYSVWGIFFAKQIINLVAAIIIACLTVSLLSIFKVDIERTILSLWGFQAVLFYSFLTLSQLFVLLLGNLGMVVNIVLVALQLATSGALVPRTLLSTTYQNIGDYLPATYGVDGYFTFIYGGESLQDTLIVLVWMIVMTLFVALLIVFCKQGFKRRQKKSQNHLQVES